MTFDNFGNKAQLPPAANYGDALGGDSSNGYNVSKLLGRPEHVKGNVSVELNSPQSAEDKTLASLQDEAIRLRQSGDHKADKAKLNLGFAGVEFGVAAMAAAFAPRPLKVLSAGAPAIAGLYLGIASLGNDSDAKDLHRSANSIESKVKLLRD